MTLDVISRLIGLHDLFLLNFYPYLQRFIQPHQREVTRILQFAAQASHELIPPDVLEPVLKSIVNNFITERNSSDVMAIGLNAVREICARCPLVMDEDLLIDLAQYKNYRDRSVMMAARSLISVFRNCAPNLLHKKDRGRPTEAVIEIKPKQYGELDVKDYVPGAEVLMQTSNENVEINSDSSDDDDDNEWIDIKHSSDEEIIHNKNNTNTKKTKGRKKNAKKENSGLLDNKVDCSENTNIINDIKEISENKSKQDLARVATLDRILTDDDFKRIEMANIKKQIQTVKKGTKRPINDENTSELVKLGNIENIYKKRKHSKEDRIESVRRGQTDREKFGYKDGRLNVNCSKTNREKRKTKNYQMIKHKLKSKVKKSFKEKQIALRNHLLKQKRMK